jgi:hypothetical protein
MLYLKKMKKFLMRRDFMIGTLMAIQVGGRTEHATKVQEILTKYGCNIKTRVGFHDTDENHCSMDGIIILQLFGKESERQDMLDELNALDEVSAKFITF